MTPCIPALPADTVVSIPARDRHRRPSAAEGSHKTRVSEPEIRAGSALNFFSGGFVRYKAYRRFRNIGDLAVLLVFLFSVIAVFYTLGLRHV
jgi:hypothetical protein